MISANITGIEDLKKSLRSYEVKTHDLVTKQVLIGCVVVRDEAKLAFRASDAESIPNVAARVQTTRYRDSIDYDVYLENDRIVGEVGTDVKDYPVALEYGTSKMPPHPILGPSYDKHEKQIADKIEAAELEAEKELKK